MVSQSDVIRLLIKDAWYRMRVVVDEKGQVSYVVGSDRELTDRFHRNYTIQAEPNGMPKLCSCPHCHETGAWCKHLKAVEAWWRENTEEGRKAQAALEAQVSRMFADQI